MQDAVLPEISHSPSSTHHDLHIPNLRFTFNNSRYFAMHIHHTEYQNQQEHIHLVHKCFIMYRYKAWLELSTG